MHFIVFQFLSWEIDKLKFLSQNRKLSQIYVNLNPNSEIGNDYLKKEIDLNLSISSELQK